MSKPQSPSLTLKRKLKAPAEKVFAAWTKPEQIVRWFGPVEAAQDSVSADMDVRVGGRFRISFNGQDGEHHEVGGTYREVVPGERLVFSWAWHSTPERESLVTVTLKADGAGTILTLHHERFFDEKARDGHERGWTGTLEKLARYLS
jgi:uncharacterized protein YndB with AHSA1/START domain